jgi:tripartite-type tricarboxylate transporter receptor subunit TctC
VLGLVVAVGRAPNLTAYPIDFQDKDFALTRTFAAGTPSQLVGEMRKLMDGVNMVRVAYKGAGIAVTGLASGAVPIFFSSVAGAHP